MALPAFLVLEIRTAFKSCAQQYRLFSRRHISSTSARLAANQSGSSPARSWPYNGAVIPQTPNSKSPTPLKQSSSDGKELVQKSRDQNAVGTERRVPVPLRVIPKPELGKGVRLSPRERLHVEVLTRHLPRAKQEKKIYRERLQIYHIGSFREIFLVLMKVSSVISIALVTVIFVPAHIKAGTSLLMVAFIGFCGFIPWIFVNTVAKPMISRIFLELPTKARETNKAALEYAQNLPRDAQLDIRYLKPWGIEGRIRTKISQLEPVETTVWRPQSFRMRKIYDEPAFWKPSYFYVYPHTAIGEKSKNTIPGLWTSVYRKIMQIPEGTDIAKWRK